MRTSSFTAWDRALDGKLVDLLARYRTDGLTFDDIVDRLRDDYDLRISRSTISRWVAIAEAEAGELPS